MDSGATHNFLFENSIFTEYEIMARETVAAAFGTHCFIIGKSHRNIPIDGGKIVLAYHAPRFDTHIFSVSHAAKKVNLSTTFGLDSSGSRETEGSS